MGERNLISFAGYLQETADDTVRLADRQGTWDFRREDIESVNDWEGAGIDGIRGRPVRLTVHVGSQVVEHRKWTVDPVPGGLGGPDFREMAKGVFSLGGQSLPFSEQMLESDAIMAALERLMSRRLGWPIDTDGTPGEDPRGPNPYAAGSKTIVVKDGYSDTDDTF